jgi:putative PEP-CTERM system TPR-repeat lipoprotein
LSGNDRASAREAFIEALKRKQEYPPALHNLAKMDMVAGDVASARSHYEVILKRDPRDPEALIGMSEIALLDGDIKQAIEWLSRSSGNSEEGVEAPLRLIALHLDNDDQMNALHIADRLFENFPENSKATEALARVQASMGRKDAAMLSYRRAVSYAGFAGPQLLRIARGQIAIGDYGGASYTLSKATNTYVGEAASLARARIEIITRNFKKADQFAEEFSDAYPDSSGDEILRAEIMEAQEKYSEAIEILHPVAGQETDNSEATVKLFEILIKAGRPEEGIALLETRTQRYPRDRGSRRALAMGYVAVQRFDEAKLLHEQLLQDSTKDAALVANLARIYQLLKHPDAKMMAERAVNLKPEWSVTLDTLGWILVTEGNPAEGLKYLRKALARDANSLTRYHLAVALNKLGRDAEARNELDRILKSEPKLKWIDDVQNLYQELAS